MKAYEVMGTLNDQKQLLLDEQLLVETPTRVKVIILLQDESNFEFDDDNEEIKKSIKIALEEAREGKRMPIEQLWEGVDAR
ncbi:MAG: hypothetical protein H7A23_06080 [Leptospiraceae bacterium]|nr:hypothetical protein [Leptospiraceae bacterium]MCP5494107.1 hypothetical protein [Leptospiraceae bacterium]